MQTLQRYHAEDETIAHIVVHDYLVVPIDHVGVPAGFIHRKFFRRAFSSYMVAASITDLYRTIFRASTFYLTDSIVTFIEPCTLKAAASPSIFPRMISPLAYPASR
jgi:hypothetical protein